MSNEKLLINDVNSNNFEVKSNNEEKQIEEMAKILCGMKNGCVGCMFSKLTCYERKDAEAIYNADYRKQEWISVEERLPEKDGRYLVAMKDGNDYHISTRKFKRTVPPIWWKGHTYGYWARHTSGVRYWMPLPEAPKMKGGAE